MRPGYNEWMARLLSAITERALMGTRIGQPPLRINLSQREIGFTRATTRAPRSRLADAISRGSINFDQPGLYNVGFDRNGGVLVSVLSGLASVVGAGGSSQINKGEMLTLLSQAASEVALSRLNRQDAGRQVDDYYRYQYPNSY